MAVEIERKFLVDLARWTGGESVTLFEQGYLCREKERTVRIRRAGERAFLTIKGVGKGLARPEYEYEIPKEDARELLSLCMQPLIEKRRHLLEHEGHTWEVDEFLGANAGLWVAEIELEGEDEPFARPAWLGKEVSSDTRYRNANLVVHPYSQWKAGA